MAEDFRVAMVVGRLIRHGFNDTNLPAKHPFVVKQFFSRPAGNWPYRAGNLTDFLPQVMHPSKASERSEKMFREGLTTISNTHDIRLNLID